MPTRLIDVGSSGDPAVRLVNTADLSGGDKVSPYIILSYCWGSGNDPARTTSRNLRGRLVSIQLKSLPKTIQDAIRVTRLMKMQYLWVDAVCIIQADKTLGAQQQDDVARADWQRESTHMGSYYMNSLCCIAASNAKDSSEGFLTERRVARYGYRKWLAPPNLFLPSPYCIREQSRSLLFDRGWCLQEWILSPRILHWTANGLVWECSHGFFWEGQTGFQEKDPEVFGDAPGDDDARQTDDCLLDFGVNAGGKASQILHSGEKEALGEAWTELVSQYSQMHLTVPSDRLAAIQGIASQLSNRHGVEYFAGVFRSRCADHLMWRTEDYETSTGVNGDFPSWSWANSRRGISFGTISHEDWGSFMEDLEPFPSAQDEESLTRIANKELCFTAPLIQFSLLNPSEAVDAGSNDSESSVFNDEDQGRNRFSLGSESPIWDGLTCNICVDDLASVPSLKDCALLLVLWALPYGERTEYRGVVLQTLKNDTVKEGSHSAGTSYRRIGMFWVDYPGHSQDLHEWRKRVVLV